jgi:hypothetical protein
MHRLRVFELEQQLPCQRRVVIVPLERGNQLALAIEPLLSLGDVSFRLRQVMAEQR